MKIRGKQIPQTAFEALCDRLDKSPCSNLVLVAALCNRVPEITEVAYRVVDRWLQLQRKAGWAEFKNHVWRRTALNRK